MNIENQRELEFASALQRLLETAREHHNIITSEEMTEAFAGMNLSDEQMRSVRDYLRSANVGIDQALPLEEVLTEEEHNYLRDYEEMAAAIEQPADGVLDAIKINAMAGVQADQMRLAELMLPKVIDIARLYAGQGVYMEDLIGIGNEALVQGVQLLAPLDGPAEVEPDLAERIMRAMEALVEEALSSTVAAQDAADLANKVMDAANALQDDLGRKVTVEELAAEGDVTEEEILEAIRVTGNKIESIDYMA